MPAQRWLRHDQMSAVIQQSAPPTVENLRTLDSSGLTLLFEALALSMFLALPVGQAARTMGVSSKERRV